MLIALICAWPARADEDPYRAAREQFQAAYAEAQQGIAPVAVDSAELRAYPLYPYLQAVRIAQALNKATAPWTDADEQAGKFLEFYDVEPVGRDLHRAWLQSLVRREQWSSFLAQYQPSIADDQLRCFYLRAHIALQRTEGLASALIEQWLTSRQLPTECEPAFQWGRAEGIVSDELIEQRVRLLLEQGHAAFARIIAARLPAERAAPLLEWADLIQRPAAVIDALIAAPARAIEWKILLDGWSRLARRDPSGALERYEPLIEARDLDERQASKMALALALGLAWDRRSEALDMFDEVGAADLDDYALQWRARTALWASKWRLLEHTIAAMSTEQREQARWRYWAARAAERRRDRQRARQLYSSVLGFDNYYAAMAAARLGQPAEPHPEPLLLDPAELLVLAVRPSLARARELLLCRLREQALAEWFFGYEMLDENARRQAIHLAASWGWHDVAVAAATRQGVFNDYVLLYPLPYDDEVNAAARLTELEPELIYAVIRQESLFHARAASPAGALGLMQLLPETARRAARRLQRPAPVSADLFDPRINVILGAAQLKALADRFDGQIIVSLAGYNAGPNAAARWLPAKPIEADVWIENIPFNETRDYVQRVLWHSVVFAWLRSGEPQDTEAWLTRIVAPRPEG